MDRARRGLNAGGSPPKSPIFLFLFLFRIPIPYSYSGHPYSGQDADLTYKFMILGMSHSPSIRNMPFETRLVTRKPIEGYISSK